MDFSTCLVVMLGGSLGTLARYLVSILAAPISRQWPLGTLLINVSGSFLIGLFATLTLANGRFPASETLRVFVMVGFCGGYTTFSSFSLQTLDLLRDGLWGRALLNVAASAILCVAAAAVGHGLAAQLNGGATSVAQLQIRKED